MLDKSRYRLSVNQGEGLRLSEIRVIRVDGESLNQEEINDLLEEFENLFPNEIFRINHQTLPEEDNTDLHVYVNLTAQELRNRGAPLGARIIVERAEIETRLQAG